MPIGWLPIASAPEAQDLRLSVVDKGEIHALVFPCRRRGPDWIDALTGRRVNVNPTHWQLWPANT